MAFLDDLGTLLVLSGVGTLYPGGNIVLGELPSDPAEVLSLVETPGIGGEKVMEDPGTSYEFPRAQLTARGADYPSGRALIGSAWTALNGIVNTPIGGSQYLKVEPLQSPFFLKRDENDRYIFAFNVEAMKGV